MKVIPLILAFCSFLSIPTAAQIHNTSAMRESFGPTIEKNIKGDQIEYHLTKLQIAIKSEDFDLVQEYILKGASVNLRANDETPLKMAIKTENIEIISLLLRSGADVEASSRNFSPLGLAILLDNAEIMELLILFGADVDRSCRELTPLTVAILEQNYTAVEFLLENGAFVDPEETVLKARIHGTPEIQELLADHLKGDNLLERLQKWFTQRVN